MTKNINVGYDGGPASTEALIWAANEAEVRGAALKIVCTYSIPAVGAVGSAWAPTEAVAWLLETADLNAAEAVERVIAMHPDLVVSTHVTAGPAYFSLVDDADADDLIAVGASSHHGSIAFWLGSTARRVVRHSPCPVIVVRGAASRGRPDRVIVGIDGSDDSTRALDWAGDEADRHGVPLVVVHAWSYPYSPIGAGTSQAADLMQIDAACVLDRAVEHARQRFGVDVTAQLLHGDVGAALVTCVRDGDLLVLGSRGRGALKAGLLGSTVNDVLDRAEVPVAIVRHG